MIIEKIEDFRREDLKTGQRVLIGNNSGRFLEGTRVAYEKPFEIYEYIKLGNEVKFKKIALSVEKRKLYSHVFEKMNSGANLS